MKKVVLLLAGLLLCSACSAPARDVREGQSGPDGAAQTLDYADWDSVRAAAVGTSVNFYGWGGDEKINRWLEDTLAGYMLKEYDITFNRVPMDIDQILQKMLGEKEADVQKGNVDLVWINGENFASAKENGLLMEDFCRYLPNYTRYVGAEDPEVTTDFGVAVEGSEAPFAKAQLVMIYDAAADITPPKSAEELLEICLENPGRFTYEAPPGFTGSAFVRNILYEICGYENLAGLPAEKEAVAQAIAPAMEYLRQLNPYLWNKGASFPSTSAQVDEMFMDGTLLFSMSYDPYHVPAQIGRGSYPETAQAFVFNKGTIGNTNYLAVGARSGNVAGALCLTNALLSVEMQASKYNPDNWGALPVLDMDKMSEEERREFSAVDIGPGAVVQEELLAHRLPELPSQLVPIIEEIWLEEVPGR